MSLELPTTLSPSKVSTFRDCALRFRFSAIERLPEPPSAAASKGTLVHAALERLFALDAPQRTPQAGQACLAEAVEAFRAHDDFTGLGLTGDEEEAFLADAAVLVANYFQLEDPTTIRPIGLELRLEAAVGGLNLVGIIDRLELDEHGELVVTDYKTGKAPRENREATRLGGVHFYSLLCEELFGRRPSRVQLLHLREPLVIAIEPSEQSTRGLRTRTTAIWAAVERACAADDFRPKPSGLCDWCSFQQWCPAFGGDPSRAAADLGVTPGADVEVGVDEAATATVAATA